MFLISLCSCFLSPALAVLPSLHGLHWSSHLQEPGCNKAFPFDSPLCYFPDLQNYTFPSSKEWSRGWEAGSQTDLSDVRGAFENEAIFPLYYSKEEWKATSM